MNQKVISPECDALAGCQREAAARLIRNELKLQMTTRLLLKGMPEGPVGRQDFVGGFPH